MPRHALSFVFTMFQKLTFDLSYLNDFIPVLHVISKFDHFDTECGSIITKREICWILVRRTLWTFPLEMLPPGDLPPTVVIFLQSVI